MIAMTGWWRAELISPSQAVVLAVRPPISLPQTSVSPAILEELIGEISSLASVYHKPAATFVGKGRFGAGEMAKKSHE